MKRIALALAVVVGLGLAGMGTSAARAAGVGFHISSGGVHVDVGRVHHGGYGLVAPGYYGNPYYGSAYIWVPGRYVRHGHYVDYIPGHWELRRTGHRHHHGPHGYH